MSRIVPNIELQGQASNPGGPNEWTPGRPIVCGTRRGVITDADNAGVQAFTATGSSTWVKPKGVSALSTTRVILVGPGGGGGSGGTSGTGGANVSGGAPCAA